MLVKGKVQPGLMKICQADFSLQAANRFLALQPHMGDKEMSSRVKRCSLTNTGPIRNGILDISGIPCWSLMEEQRHLGSLGRHVGQF